jgi:CMP-2-keto-3-deoxyoctulosonic acid synthetase
MVYLEVLAEVAQLQVLVEAQHSPLQHLEDLDLLAVMEMAKTVMIELEQEAAEQAV